MRVVTFLLIAGLASIWASAIAQGVDWRVGQYAKITRTSKEQITAQISGFTDGYAIMRFKNGQNYAIKKVPVQALEAPSFRIRGSISDPTFTMEVDGQEITLDRMGRIQNQEGEALVPVEVLPVPKEEDFQDKFELTRTGTVKIELDAEESLNVLDPEDLSDDLKASAHQIGNAELQLLRDFPPVRKFVTEDFTFFLSRPFRSFLDQRIYAVMYSKTNRIGLVYRRILYRSLSDGGWRSPPAIDPNGYLWKYNRFQKENRHYTQETKTAPQIEQILFDLERAKTPEVVRLMFSLYFSKESLLHDCAFTYHQEVTFFDDFEGVLHHFQKYQPGSNLREATQFERKRQREDLTFRSQTLFGQVIDLNDYMASLVSEEMMGPRKFIPDFKEAPVREYKTHHSLLSSPLSLGGENDIQVRVYDAFLGKTPVEWHMANDSNGRVWINRIVPKNAKINSYGVLNAVIDTGALTHKPLEYLSLIPKSNLSYTQGFNKDYVDITPFLNELLPIKKYRGQWKIPYLDSLPASEKRLKGNE